MSTWAQIDVTATAGTPGPTTYSNLRLAFAAVNDGTHQGAITIDIISSPSTDNNTAVLNASGSGSASYTSVLIQPDGSSGSRSITGTVDGAPLVDLNGADNVTMDGRIGGGYGLTLSNQSTASSAGTSTIRFINDASNNTLRGLSILGRSTGAVATASGNVLFSTGSSTGNDDNTIVDCTIANDGTSTTDLISKAITSVGSTSTLALHNSGNQIRDCLVHDFFHPAGSRGILLGAGNHAWTISGGRFFQSDARSSASASNQHHVIDVTNGSASNAGGHVIDGNIIGHADASGTGTWTLSGNATVFRAIRVDLPNTAPRSSISGNTIAGLQHSTSAGGTGGSSPSSLIHVLGGPVDVHGNTIGVQEATGSIVFTPNTTGRHFHAILNSGSDDWSTAHNSLGGITVEGSAGLYALCSTASGQWQCDSNVVGGSVANSLWMSGTHSSAVVHGISSSGATLHSTGNTVRNLGSAGLGTATVIGIHASGGALVSAQDTITLLSSAARARAIAAEGASLTATGNVISNIQGGYIDGIHVTSAPATLSMNSISALDGTVTGSSSTSVYGIFVSGDSLTASGNTITGLSNPAMGSNARTRGVHVANGVLNATDNTISELVAIMVDGIHATETKVVATENTIRALSSNGTTQHAMVNGIVVLEDTALLVGNTVEDLNNTSTGSLSRIRGIHATDAYLTAMGNTITELNTGRNVDGISANGGKATLSGNTIASLHGSSISGIDLVNAPASLSMNSIHTLYCAETGNSNTSVSGIFASGDSLTASGNTITGLTNLATGSNARAKGIHVANGVLNATDNAISELVAIMVDGMYALQTAVVATDNTIQDLSSNGTTQHAMVNGIVVLEDTALLAGNTVEGLANTSIGSLSRTRGVHAVDAVVTAANNEITDLSALWNTDGISLTNGGADLEGNTMVHFRSVHINGISADGVVLNAMENAISDLVSTGTTQNVTVHGISTTGGVLTTAGNTIHGISSTSTGATSRAMGIHCTDGVLTASGDSISGLSAINVHGINTVRTPMLVIGTTVHHLAGTGSTQNALVNGIVGTDSTLVAQNNTITQLTNTATGGTAATRGILVTNAPLTATGNTIAKLSGNGTGTTVPGVAGIAAENSSGTPLVLLRSNTIHTLHSTHTTNTGQVHAIHARLRDTTNVIEANRIHSLWRSTSSTAANPIRGIHLAAGSSTVRNNMVRIGLDSAGASVNAAHVFQGIHEAAGIHAILHNTVYIGGEATTASSNHSYALYSEVTGTRDHRNNILWNARSNGTGSAKHYAVGVNASLTGLVSDHNCLYVTGSGGHVGREGTTDRITLSAWQAATSLDGNSLSTNPGLVRPEGDATEVDLHIQHNSAGAAALFQTGATGTGVLHDFDGAQRHSPPDIGADQILLVLPDFYAEPDKPSFNYWRNKGQVVDTEYNPRPDVKFYTDQGLPRTYLRSGSIISFTHTRVDTVFATPDTTWRVDLRFTGGKDRAVDPQPVDMRDPYRNYYLPWCGPNGATQVHGFGRVVYEDLYPYTDLHFYSGSGGPKLAFVIRPGGDMDNIQLEFEGQDSLTVDANGVLHAHVSGWDFPLIGGIAYQVNGSTIIPVGLTTYLNSAGSPVVEIGMSSFSMPLDTELPLVIMAGWPPMMGGQVTTDGVCWSTYLGGDGRDAVEDSDVDEEGNYYVVGHTFSQDIYFPIGDGQVYYQASPMAFASKFGTGYEIRWSTFYGGSFGWQAARCARVRPGADPNLLVGGFTNANDLWSSPPNDDRYYDPSSSRGGFLAEFNAEGEAVWSTYIGDGAWSVLDVDLHPNGNFAIVGSAEWFLPEEQETPDPTADHWGYSGTLDQNYPGDGFITLFNADRRTIWSTYIGGNYGDAVETVRFGTQKIVIAGQTTSTNLPLKEDGGQDALNEDYQGNGDVFIMEFDLVGRQIWSTYFGGGSGESIGDQGLALQPVFDNGREDIFIVGMSSSDDLDLENGPNWHDETYKPGLQGYILRINGEDRTIEWLTHVKGLGAIQRSTHLNTVLVDALGRIFVAGLSWDPTFVLEPGFGIYSADAMYGVGDGVILCFSNEQELRWSTYFGGDEGGLYGDDIRTLALAGTQRLYAAGTTYSAFGPTSFFPFTDPVGDDDWFDDTFFPEMDGFLAAFCIEDLLISVAEAVRPTSNAGFTVQYAPEGWYQLVGLPLGTHRWSVLDVRGRAVLDRSSMVGEAPLRFDLDGSAPGIYLVHVPGIGAQRLVHQP